MVAAWQVQTHSAPAPVERCSGRNVLIHYEVPLRSQSRLTSQLRMQMRTPFFRASPSPVCRGRGRDRFAMSDCTIVRLRIKGGFRGSSGAAVRLDRVVGAKQSLFAGDLLCKKTSKASASTHNNQPKPQALEGDQVTNPKTN